MKVLYLCHRFPYPPKRGGKIRPFNMIRHLGEQGHEVTVCSLVRSPEEAKEGEDHDPNASHLQAEGYACAGQRHALSLATAWWSGHGGPGCPGPHLLRRHAVPRSPADEPR